MSKSTLDRTRQARILVVDDEPNVRLLLAREISDRGHEVVAIADGAQAMEEMGRGDFDAVLTDIRMPGMDGMALTGWIKRTRPDTDVIVMTAYATLESAATAVRLGAFDYLLKPFGEMDLVISSIDRAIQKRRLEESLRWSVEEIRASRASFRSVVEKNSDGIVIVDRRGNVRFANPAVETLLNRKVEKLMGGPFGLPVVAGETTEHEIIDRRGEKRVTEMHVVETEWEGEIAYLASLRDITERKRTTEQIQRKMQEVAALHDINLAVASTLDLRAVLDTLMEKIDLALPGSAVLIWLKNSESGELERVACRNINEEEWEARKFGVALPLSWEVMETKAPVVVRNIQTDPRTLDPEFFRKHGLVSYLGVPIGAKGEVLGILSFLTREEHQFSNEEVAFLYTVAGQAAIAIHNAQLYEQVEQRTHELSALQSVTATASQSLDLDIVLQEVIKEIREIFYFDATRIFLFNPQMDELYLRASFEIKPEPWAQVRAFLRGQGIAGRVGETGEPLIFEDVQSDPQYQKLSHTKATQHAGYSFLGVFPIKSKLWTLGTIACKGQNPRRLTPGEIQLITSMAGQIGIAVENATLFQKTVTRAKELSALSRRLVEVQEVERRSIARELHDEVGQLLTGLKLTLNRSRRAPAGTVDDSIGKALTLVDQLIKRVRELSLDLRPAMLEDLGLLPVLLWHFEQYTAQTNVKVGFEHSGLEGQRFQLDVETAAYRIVQESLTNIARHAKVRRATVRVWADQSRLNLQIEDRGSGFDPQAAQAGGRASGLTGMRERAISLGGQLMIESAPGARSGTKLTADLPLGDSDGRRLGK